MSGPGEGVKGVRTREEYARVIDDVMRHGVARPLLNRRVGYWKDGVVVVYDPNDVSGGTAFEPRAGRSYFDDELT